MSRLEIHPVPILQDNYCHVLRCPESGAVGVVDPGEAGPVLAFLAARGWQARQIFITHRHGDHVGGLAELKAAHDSVVIGPAAEAARIGNIDIEVAEGFALAFGHAVGLVIETPGHTAGHVCYWFEDATQNLFSGDALFSLGCGRLFEGTATDGWNSLKKLRNLPEETAIWCGHEYSQANAAFALCVDPRNEALQRRARQIDEQRAAGLPTLPARLTVERAANPFLRADDPGLMSGLGMAGADPAEVFAELRRRKDHF